MSKHYSAKIHTLGDNYIQSTFCASMMWKCLIIVLYMINDVASGRNDITIDADRGSWLSDEDFEVIVRYSYPFSTCCNTLIHGPTAETTELFNRFVKIYRNGYTNGRFNNACRGYFLLGSTDEILLQAVDRVPTSISTTELLIIVDSAFEEASPLLNVSLFRNSNVNIITRSGYWRLSENYLAPRRFMRVVRNSDMIRKRGIVDLEGRQLQVATTNLAPFSYLSTTVNLTVNGIEGEFFLAEDERELDGVELKLFLIMAEYLNFTWMMRKPTGPYRHGRAKDSSWEGGMIGQLLNKEVDLAFGEIWLEYDQFQFVNLSVPWYQIWINFVVPRPKPIENVWALARPFHLDVWIAVAAVVFFKSLGVWGRARINPNVPLRFRNFMNTLTEMIGRLVGSWAPRETHGIRIQLQLWHMAGLLVVTAYSSSLAARLTTPDYEPRIDTIQQFLAANLTWGREGSVPNYRRYFDLNDPYAKQLPGKFQLESSQHERELKMARGNYAIVGQISHSIFFPRVNVSSSDLTNYRAMRESTAEFYVSFGAQSWLIDSIDTMILRLSESGLVAYHLRDVTHRRANGSLKEVFVEHDGENTDGPRPLKLKPLGAGFVLLLTGHAISTVIFYFEIRGKRKNATIMEDP